MSDFWQPLREKITAALPGAVTAKRLRVGELTVDGRGGAHPARC